MGALILKDILALKKSMLMYLGFIVLYFFIGIASNNSGFYLVFIVLLCAMLPMSALAYDERCHWDRQGLCLPIRRRDIVLSKYALALIGFLVSAVPILLMYFVRSLLGGQSNLTEDLQTVVLLSGMALTLTAIQMPFLFWLGSERGRFVTIILALGIGFGIPLLVMRDPVEPALAENVLTQVFAQLWLIPLAGLILLAISACISILIYNRKEIS